MSVVKVIRSALRWSISVSPGSWIVTSPRESASTFSGRMSRAITWWPSSAKQAAVTSPTQPTPITPTASRSLIRLCSPSSRFSLCGSITWQDSAIPIICLLVSDCCRLLEIQ